MRLLNSNTFRVACYITATIIFSGSIVSLLNAKSKYLSLLEKFDKINTEADSFQQNIDALQPTFNSNSGLINVEKPTDTIKTKKIIIPTEALTSAANTTLYFPSVMYLDKPDSVKVLNDDRPLVFVFATADYVSPKTDLRPKYALHNPFDIVNKKVVLNTILRDSLGEPFLAIRNDSLIPIKNNKAQPERGYYNITYSANNMTIIDPKGKIVVCLRKLQSEDGQYVQLMGRFKSIYENVDIIIGDKETVVAPSSNIHRPTAPPIVAEQYYQQAGMINPFIYNNGILVGELIGFLSAKKRA